MEEKDTAYENKRYVILIGDVIKTRVCQNRRYCTDLFETAIDGQTVLASDDAEFSQAHYSACRAKDCVCFIIVCICFVFLFSIPYLPDKTMSSI